MKNFIIYGGSFDPIHNGHMETALRVQNYFNFDRFLFMPCKIPLLKKEPIATPTDRIKMIELAMATYKEKCNFKFEIDLSEINRDSPSYMVDSLEHFRKQFGAETAIILLMGMDAFNQLPSWHRWIELIELANLLIIKRIGYTQSLSSEPLKKLLKQHETQDSNQIKNQSHGLIYQFDAGSFDFSSTWIRQQIKQGANIQAYVPTLVFEYMMQNHIYSSL